MDGSVIVAESPKDAVDKALAAIEAKGSTMK
jgi:hypothetical protein